MGLCCLSWEEFADCDLLSWNVVKDMQGKLSECIHNGLIYLWGFSLEGSQDIVVLLAILDLFKQRYRLTFNEHSGLERLFRDHEAVKIVAVLTCTIQNEAIRKRIGSRDCDRALVFQRLLVMNVLLI